MSIFEGIFDNEIKLVACADDTTIFIKDLNSFYHLIHVIDQFRNFSSLKLNMEKSELCAIGVLKGVQVAFCGCKVVYLTRECIKILGIYFSYNSSLAGDKNFMDSVANVERLLAIWSMGSLRVAGRIQVFKSLAVSKILYVAGMNLVPIGVFEQILKIQKKFIWNSKKPKIKHTTSINDYQDRGLKDVDIEAKIRSLQLGWVWRLFADDYHPWKIIPLNVLKKFSGKNIFHRNLDIDLKKLPATLPKFYSGLIQTWCETIAYDPVDIAEVLFEHLWYNRHHKISKKPFIFYPFESVGINHVADLFINQHQIHWPSVKSKFNLAEKLHFKWLQLVKVISDKWANIIKTGIGSTQGLNNEKFSVMIDSSHVSITQLTSKCIYMHIVNKIATVPTAQRWFKHNLKSEQNQDSYNFDWNKIYMLPRKSTTDSRTRVFQFRLLNNVLYFSDQLYKMTLVVTPLCSLCNKFTESAIHFFPNVVQPKLFGIKCNTGYTQILNYYH